MLFWLLLGCLSACCTGAVLAAGQTPLVLALSKSPLSLPFYVAQKQGYFDAEGVALQIHDVIGGVRSLQQLRRGEADLATSSDTVVMFNSFVAKDFAVLGSFVTSPDDLRIIVRPGLDFSNYPAIKGKRFAVTLASASHYYLDTWLLLNGIDPNSITRVGMPPEAMESALAKAEVDAVSTWEPFGISILRAMPQAKALTNPGMHTLSFNLMVHVKHLGQKDPELVKILRALERAQRFIQAEPVKSLAILRERLQLEATFIEAIWQRYNYRLTLNQSLLTTLESQARWARQEGHVQSERMPNYLDFVYPEPLRSVRRDAVGLSK
jgi:NitT/TauT family transport system substrate-binding protein